MALHAILLYDDMLLLISVLQSYCNADLLTSDAPHAPFIRDPFIRD